ncbi:MAG: hypothetical protein KAS93_00125 [Gammaproteobacteria bacterium]|nr:hypothetical protein [Gammaproteobacteria bacterium]
MGLIEKSQKIADEVLVQLTPIGGELITAVTLRELVDSYTEAFARCGCALPYLDAYVLSAFLVFAFTMDKIGKIDNRFLRQANNLWLTTVEWISFKIFLMRALRTARSGLAGFRGEEVDVSNLEYVFQDLFCWCLTLMNRSPVFVQQMLAILPSSVHEKWHEFWHPQPDLFLVWRQEKRRAHLRWCKDRLAVWKVVVPDKRPDYDDVTDGDYRSMEGLDAQNSVELGVGVSSEEHERDGVSDVCSTRSYWLRKVCSRVVSQLTFRSAANFEAVLNWGVFMHAVPAIAEGIAIAARDDKGYTGTAAMVWRSLRYGFAIVGMGFGACENFSQKNRERLYFLILFLYVAIVLPFFQITKRDEIKGWPQGAMLFSFIFVLLVELAILAINFGRVIGGGLSRLNQAVPDEVDMLRQAGSFLSSGLQRFFGRNEEPVRQSVVVEMAENLLSEEDMLSPSSLEVEIDGGSGVEFLSDDGLQSPLEDDMRYSVSDGGLTEVVPSSTDTDTDADDTESSHSSFM